MTPFQADQLDARTVPATDAPKEKGDVVLPSAMSPSVACPPSLPLLESRVRSGFSRELEAMGFPEQMLEIRQQLGVEAGPGTHPSIADHLRSEKELREAFSFDPEDPLARCPGESHKGNQWLRTYALMGVDRTLSRTATALCKSMSRVRKVAYRFRWLERAQAFDVLEAKKEEETWRERRREVRELDYVQGGKLRDLGGQLLDVLRQGAAKIESIDGRLVVSALKEGSSLQRLASELDTGRESSSQVVIVKAVKGVEYDEL